jgi:hypothetical protein
MYILVTAIILVGLSKLQSNITYSIQSTEVYGSNNILGKDIPGIFPPLSSYRDEILGNWKVKLLSSESGPENLSHLNYRIEFKHV